MNPVFELVVQCALQESVCTTPSQFRELSLPLLGKEGKVLTRTEFSYEEVKYRWKNLARQCSLLLSSKTNPSKFQKVELILSTATIIPGK